MTVAAAQFGGKPILDPVKLRKQFLERGWPTGRLELANTFTCPRGIKPSMGYLLMRRKDVLEVKDTSFHTLKFEFGSDKITIPQALYLTAEALVPVRTSIDQDEAPYLVTVSDARWLMQRSFINKQYNVRSIGDPEGEYWSSTRNTDLDPVEDWTWATMFSDVWGHMDSQLAGSGPSLAFTPTAPPERWRFLCRSALSSIGEILDHLHCDLVYDPTTDAFATVQIGQGNTAEFDTLVTNNASHLIWDSAVVDSAKAYLPEKVVVCFLMVHDGAPEQAVTLNPYYTLEYESTSYDPTADSRVVAGTRHIIFDDLEALGGCNSGDPSNLAALQARRDERANDYYTKLDIGMRRSVRRYDTLVKFIPGRMCSEVTWGLTSSGVLTEIQRK